MIVLGIHDGHDAGVALVRDGRLVLCSSEERRRNVKNWAGVPTESLQAVFQRSGIVPKDIDLIALSGLIRNMTPSRDYKPGTTVLFSLAWLGRTQTATRWGRWLLAKIRKRRELLAALADLGLDDKRIVPFDHHLCHAATAYFHRPWSESATILTMDGAGDGLCATVGVGEGGEMKVLAQTPKFHSVAAWMYSAVTAHLGLRPYEHEYKVMGMAPYGQAEYCADVFRRAFTVDGLQFRNHTGRLGRGMQGYLLKRLANQRFDNVSAACQLVFEELVVQWARNAMAATGVNRLCAAGGAFLNVKANKLIRELPEVEKLYVYPASDDGGTPFGAALLGYQQLCQERGHKLEFDLPRDMYLGLEFSDQECEVAARESGLRVQQLSDPARTTGELLAAGKILGRFSGREELGPRALGNRSILADARDLRVIRKLNFAIKQRDFWMPFAASVLAEDADRYIKNLSPWPFWMIEAFDSTPLGAEALVAGTHPFDLTIRPQVVNELNPSYRDVIRAFRSKTGVGGLLNTSFNLHGYPIVGTPEIAIDTLKKSDLDGVVLGPYLVEKPSDPPAVNESA
ncbi:MAG TPA: carbamoyltransferase C-terminal domain-containing protein [Gemmatales bacterium]|nr:carbamoyltransferase C-terminal domain-containing protein [Gemmatales bacterium]